MLTNQGTSPFTVYKVESTVPGISVDVSAPFELVGGAGKTLTVRLSPGVEGQLDGALAITTDSDTAGERGVAHIPFSALGVKAVLEVRPRAIDFGNVELDSVKLQELVVVNPSAAKTKFRFDLEGEDADLFSSSDEGRVLEIGPGETRPLPLAFKPGRMGVALATAKVSVCPVCEPVPVALTGSGVTSALEVTPLRVDFGRVPVGASAEQLVYVRNLGTEPLPFSGVELLSNDAGLFSISRKPSTTSLAAGASLQIGVSFTPKVNGPAPSALLHVKVQAPNTSSTGPKLALVGEGGRGCIVVLPSGLDFGEVPENVGYTRAVTVLNRCQAPVWLSDFSLKTDAGGFFSLGTASPTISIAANGSAEVPVVFTPRTGSGTSQGSLTFRSTDGGSANSTELVALTGSTRKFAPCSYRLAPDTLDFGRVAVGAEVVLGLTLENTGTDVCFVSGIGLASGSDAAFTSTPPSSPRIAPGAKATLLVSFRPTDAGTFGALAEAFVNSPTQGHPTAPIAGEGVQSCFTVQPATIDFGRMKLGCDPRTRPVVAKNACTGPVDLAAPALDADGSAAFSLAGAGRGLARRGHPGDVLGDLRSGGRGRRHLGDPARQLRRRVHRRARRQRAGAPRADRSLLPGGPPEGRPALRDRQLGLDDGGAAEPRAELRGAALRGRGGAGRLPHRGHHHRPHRLARRLDRVPGRRRGRRERPALPGERVDAADHHPADPERGPGLRDERPGRLVPLERAGAGRRASGRSPSRCSRRPTIRARRSPPTATPGSCGPTRSSRSCSSPTRRTSRPQPVSFYETYFRALKNDDPSLLTVSAIVGPENLSTCPTAASVGSRYLALARATGGVTESICTPNWAASLKNLSDNAFGARRSFALSQLPADPAQITVTVDGEPVTSGWTYEAAPNAVIFEVGKAPEAGALVEVSYPLGC